MHVTKNLLSTGAKNVVFDCMKITSSDRVVLISDKATDKISAELQKQIAKTGAALLLIHMEDHGTRPMTSFPNAMKKAITDFAPTVSIFAGQGQKGELGFRSPMIKHVLELGVRHGHMIGIVEDIMHSGMQADYKEVDLITRKVYSVVKNAKHVTVTTPAGTDLSVDLGFKWKLCTGLLHKPGDWSNLPDGELFTTPRNINGTLVVDGCLGDWMTEKYGKLKTPVRIEIVDGYATSITCLDKEIEKDVREYLAQHKNSNRVGEFAVGTNLALTELIGNLLQDEKFPGIHVAFGHPYPEDTGVSWDCPSHLDCVLRKTTIVVDGKTIMRDGRFEKEILG